MKFINDSHDIITACNNKDLEAVKYFLNVKDINRKYDGYTALYTACHTNYISDHEKSLEIVKYLVDNGACVNKSSHENVSAIYKAVECNNLNLVNYLIERKADVHTIENYGYSNALEAAISNRNYTITKLLLENGANLKHRERKKALKWLIDQSNSHQDFCKSEAFKIFDLLITYDASLLQSHEIQKYMEVYKINVEAYKKRKWNTKDLNKIFLLADYLNTKLCMQ